MVQLQYYELTSVQIQSYFSAYQLLDAKKGALEASWVVKLLQVEFRIPFFTHLGFYT